MGDAPGMKTCKACGTSTADDDAEFCIKCGEYFPKPGTVPDTGSVGQAPAGILDMMQQAQGQMPETELQKTVAKWAAAIRDGLVVDDDTYRQILGECLDSIFRMVAKPVRHPHSTVSELTILIDDHDLLTDILKGMEERMGHIGYQLQAMNAVNEYIKLAIDGFSVYTDLPDLKVLCDDAVAVLDGMLGRFDSLEPVTTGNPPKPYLESYSQFFSLVGDRISRMEGSVTPERAEFLSEYWADRSGKRFSDLILAAANMHVQLILAGRLSSKLAVKARDMQLDAFERMYLSPKEQ